MKINVNGAEKVIGEVPELLYWDLIILAGFKAGREGLTITYFGPKHGDMHREGTVLPGKPVRPEEGMVFNVADTSSA